jgi:type I restriction enzyme, S subunit
MSSSQSLLDIADLIRGVSYKRDEARTAPERGLLPVLRANNISDGHLTLEDGLVYVPTSRVSEAQKIKKGDIVLAMSSGSRDVVGKAALATADWDGGFGAFCAVLRTRSGTRPEWLAHFMRSPTYRHAIDDVATGTNINNLSKTTLAAIQVPRMTEQLQLQLARVLDHVAASSSSSRQHLEGARRVIERFRQAVLVAACSGRLTADWREANSSLEPTAIELLKKLRSTNRKTAEAPRHAFDLDVPDTWEVTTGADAFTFVTSGSRGWAKYYSESGASFLRVGNLDRYTLDLDLSSVQSVSPPRTAESTRTRVQSRDILISITAEVGMVGVVPDGFGEGYVNQHVAIARPNALLEARFIAAFIASPTGGEKQLDALQRGATKAGLGLDDIRAMTMPLPPPLEQAEIVRRVSQLFGAADRLSQRVASASKRVDRSSQAILAKAFRGGLAP